jgi:hypothetical protein
LIASNHAASDHAGWLPDVPLLPARRLVSEDSEQRSRKVTMKMARSGGNAFFTNFSTYDAPFPSKVRLALANTWKKARTRSDCCGNHGEPGC